MKYFADRQLTLFIILFDEPADITAQLWIPWPPVGYPSFQRDLLNGVLSIQTQSSLVRSPKNRLIGLGLLMSSKLENANLSPSLDILASVPP